MSAERKRGHGESGLGVFVWLLAASTTGCMGGLRVNTVATSVDKPSNVAVYFSVNKDHAPVAGLFEKNFQISEDGQDLTADQTKQTLLPRDMVAVHRALLLVDMSGPVAIGDTRAKIASAVARFVTKAHASEPVTVFAFDGGASVKLVGEYPQGTDDIADIASLASYTQTDSSSNLNSAIVEALSELDARLMTQQKPIRVGSLVVFARGPDLAGRVSEDKMTDAIEDSDDLVYTVDVKDGPGFHASRLGRAGTFTADTIATIDGTLEHAGETLAAAVNGYYLLSYCSPARAGDRHFRIKVTTTDEKGQDVYGTLGSDFDATGFTSGCDPTTRPRFVIRPKPDAKHERHDDKDDDHPKHDASPATSHGAEPAAATPGNDEGDAVVPPPAKPGYAQ